MTGGQLDGGPPDFVEHHPNVGALLVKVSDFPPELAQVCSGSVLSRTEFLTAGHCTDFLTGHGLTADQVFVSFESHLAAVPGRPITPDPATQIPVNGWVTHPTFRPNVGLAP
jgi:hypothetical protein